MFTIVNCSSISDELKRSANFVYCGRKWGGFEASPLRNEFKKGSRHQNIEDFKTFLWHQLVSCPMQPNPEIEELNRIDMLEKELGHVFLGCWCAPRACHTSIIIDVIEFIRLNDSLNIVRISPPTHPYMALLDADGRQHRCDSRTWMYWKAKLAI